MDETIIDAERGIVKCQHRRVAIIGAAPRRIDAPWHDDSWCLWGLNEIAQPRADRWFELHPMAVQNKQELAWLKACRAPVYTLDYVPEQVPLSVKFPLDRIREAGMRDYFTCTFAFQIALAVLDGFNEIGLWGVQLFLGTPRERTVERACVEYWIGYAEGRGIKVSADSSLARHQNRYLYGYDYAKEKAAVDRIMERLGEGIGERYGRIVRED